MTDAAPVRVAYLCGEYPRATDTFVQSEVAGLRQHGVHVETLSVRRPDTILQARLFGGDIPDGRVVGLDESPTPVGLVASDPRTRTRTIVSEPISVGH